MTDWNPIKISFLRRYREATLRIEDREEEIRRIRQRLLPGAQHISDMPGGGKKADWTDTIATIIELEQSVGEEIERLKSIRDSVMRVIESVQDDRYRVLLDKRYISGKTWEKIAEEMYVDYVTVWRWHGCALEMVEIPNE